jgi:hypothetical protein
VYKFWCLSKSLIRIFSTLADLIVGRPSLVAFTCPMNELRAEIYRFLIIKIVGHDALLEISNCFRILPSFMHNIVVTTGSVQNTRQIMRNVMFTDPIRIMIPIVSANA